VSLGLEHRRLHHRRAGSGAARTSVLGRRLAIGDGDGKPASG
jgi:hypothetical protein